MKTHFNDSKYSGVVCGTYLPPLRTSDPNEVTCGNCRVTRSWKDAKVEKDKITAVVLSTETIQLSFDVKEKVDYESVVDNDKINDMLWEDVEIINTLPDGRKVVQDSDNGKCFLLTLTVNKLEIETTP